MKIFLSFLQGPSDYPVPAYAFWQHYMKQGITEAGFEWTECAEADWAKGISPLSKKALNSWQDETWSKTIAHLKNNRPDIFLSYLYPQQIASAALHEIRKMGIPCVNFFCDNYREFDKIPNAFSSFDLHWVPEFKSSVQYQQAGLNHLHLPMPMWVSPAYRNTKITENQQVTFIGSADRQRIALLNLLALKSDDLKVYGRGWLDQQPGDSQKNSMFSKAINQIRFLGRHGLKKYQQKIIQSHISIQPNTQLQYKLNGNLNFEDYNNLTRTSMVTLGINRFPSFHFPFERPGSYSRLRDIEAPMLGACYLTEWTEGIEQLFDTETEIACYHDTETLHMQIERLKKDTALRKQLRKNGQLRALSDHSIPETLKKLFNKLSLHY